MFFVSLFVFHFSLVYDATCKNLEAKSASPQDTTGFCFTFISRTQSDLGLLIIVHKKKHQTKRESKIRYRTVETCNFEWIFFRSRESEEITVFMIFAWDFLCFVGKICEKWKKKAKLRRYWSCGLKFYMLINVSGLDEKGSKIIDEFFFLTKF